MAGHDALTVGGDDRTVGAVVAGVSSPPSSSPGVVAGPGVESARCRRRRSRTSSRPGRVLRRCPAPARRARAAAARRRSARAAGPRGTRRTQPRARSRPTAWCNPWPARCWSRSRVSCAIVDRFAVSPGQAGPRPCSQQRPRPSRRGGVPGAGAGPAPGGDDVPDAGGIRRRVAGLWPHPVPSPTATPSTATVTAACPANRCTTPPTVRLAGRAYSRQGRRKITPRDPAYIVGTVKLGEMLVRRPVDRASSSMRSPSRASAAASAR